MTAIATSNMLNTGVLPSFVAASTSDTAEIGSGTNTYVVYRNTGTQKTISIAAPGTTSYGQNFPAGGGTLLATTGELWIPLRKEFDQGSSNPGRALITMTPDATGVTMAVVRHS